MIYVVIRSYSQLIITVTVDSFLTILTVQNGWTPLCNVAYDGRTEIAELLLNCGAIVDLPTKVSRKFLLLLVILATI